MAELPPARVVEFLGGIPPGEVRCLLARVGGLGERGREGDPDPVDIGSGPVPRSAVRLVALEAAVWEGELRIDRGPGYRVYYGRDGDDLVVLLAGGTKKRQTHDIQTARALWKAYRQEKRHARQSP